MSWHFGMQELLLGKSVILGYFHAVFELTGSFFLEADAQKTRLYPHTRLQSYGIQKCSAVQHVKCAKQACETNTTTQEIREKVFMENNGSPTSNRLDHNYDEPFCHISSSGHTAKIVVYLQKQALKKMIECLSYDRVLLCCSSKSTCQLTKVSWLSPLSPWTMA